MNVRGTPYLFRNHQGHSTELVETRVTHGFHGIPWDVCVTKSNDTRILWVSLPPPLSSTTSTTTTTAEPNNWTRLFTCFSRNYHCPQDIWTIFRPTLYYWKIRFIYIWPCGFKRKLIVTLVKHCNPRRNQWDHQLQPSFQLVLPSSSGIHVF